MLSFNAGKTIATDLQLQQLNRHLCRPPCFSYKKLGWFFVRLVYPSFLDQVSRTSFLYKKLGSSVRGLMVFDRLALPPFAVCLHAAASFLKPIAVINCTRN